jgi:flagellar basal body rod protein FlgG
MRAAAVAFGEHLGRYSSRGENSNYALLYGSHLSRHLWTGFMSLASVFQTARSGLSAAVARVESVSHNIANSQTNGYKAREPVYATQGTSTHGRENSLQVGLGVQVAGYATDDSQGPLVASSVADRWGENGWVDGSESWVGDGVIELSNTDVGDELVALILAEGLLLASASVIDTADSLLGELAYLERRHD